MSTDSRIRRSLSTQAEVDRLLRRIRCQIEFGRAIDDGRFAAALEKADRTYSTYKTYTSIDELRDAVEAAENELAEIAKEAKTFTIHCVGHGHIDMNWMWSWPETCATTHDTFASVLALMEEYPELTYSQSQASVYALVEKYHPAMFSQIRDKVREGRWEVAAVHWVEGDKNLASGESLAHHLLYTRQYFAEKFGLTPEDCQLDWEPDTFGHCNTLPGILRQGGVKYYYCCRPGGGQEHLRVGNERPPIFWWQSPDGSRVLVNKETTWYNSYVEIGDNFALPAASFFKKTGLKDWLNVYGIGNHGGGPTRSEIDYFLETRDWPCWPRVEFGTAQGYMRKIEPLCADMPVLDHELNYEFTGCYTSQSAIKKANRYGENYCVEAETLEAISKSSIVNCQSSIREAWINVLFNQFHDILPGSGVQETRQHALGLFQETGAITGAIKRNALQALAKYLDTISLLPDTAEAADERSAMNRAGESADKSAHSIGPFEAGAGQGAGESGISLASGGGKRFRPMMIYNPCAWVRSEMVEVNLYDLPEEIPADKVVALDEEGAAHPTLDITSIAGGNHDWGHRRITLLFEAKDIPALGYRAFLFCEGEAEPNQTPVQILGETTVQTAWGKIDISKYGSGLREVVLNRDRELVVEWAPLGQWVYVVERAKGMSAWQLSYDWFSGDYLEGFGPSFRTYGGRRNEATDLRSGQSFVLVADQKLVAPKTKSSVRLKTVIGSRMRVDWFAEIDWREIGDSEAGIPGLQIAFSSAIERYESKPYVFETPFGFVVREPVKGKHEGLPWEVPSLRFAHRFGGIEGDSAGMTVLQDSKYGHGADHQSELGLRVLRSTYEPDLTSEVAKSTMRYAVVFHDTEPTKAELVRLGAAFNHPLIVVPVLLQDGSRPTKRAFAEVETESVVLSTMKISEDGKRLILRLVNYADESVHGIVKLDPDLVEGYTKATPIDLMERPFEGAASLEGNIVRLQIGANSFATVALS